MRAGLLGARAAIRLPSSKTPTAVRKADLRGKNL
jgi:hypothetical protein